MRVFCMSVYFIVSRSREFYRPKLQQGNYDKTCKIDAMQFSRLQETRTFDTNSSATRKETRKFLRLHFTYLIICLLSLLSRSTSLHLSLAVWDSVTFRYRFQARRSHLSISAYCEFDENDDVRFSDVSLAWSPIRVYQPLQDPNLFQIVVKTLELLSYSPGRYPIGEYIRTSAWTNNIYIAVLYKA